MESQILKTLIQQMFKELEPLIAQYPDSPEDWSISQGNVAACIITESGEIFGKVFGEDKLKQRAFFKVAWTKASQVWITGHPTGAYESIVFSGNMNPEDSPIPLPDLIGWEGGQVLKVGENTTLNVGFSGFKGYNDLAIMKLALANALRTLGGNIE
jgi:uncharacterized protein GlcG (DUF336 family)